MMKKWFLLCWLLILLTMGVTCQAALTLPPKPTGADIYVQDYAGVLTPQTRQKLNTLGRTLDQKTTAQLAVVTVKTLNGAPTDEYALGILRSWGIGSKEKNNGALLLISVNDRKSRIEVGYGLEGVLPDGLTGRIQDQYMLPYFKQGQYDQGIVNGYVAAAQLIAKDAGVDLATGQGVKAPAPANDNFLGLGDDDLELLTYIIIVLIIIFFTSRGGGGGGNSRHHGGFYGGGGYYGGGSFGGGSFGGGSFGGGSFGGGGFGGGSGGGGGSSRGW
ncbi:MAG: TPM domain-containing protein [Acidaminococcaceae bacterium]|jgi:uncharacterized protein|nr:TPM domain-containing protein [Acidaminococcaceae bacterium]